MKKWLYKHKDKLVGVFVISEIIILLLCVFSSALDLNLLPGIFLVLLAVNTILVIVAMSIESHFIDNKDRYFKEYCTPLSLRESRLKKIKRIERHPILAFFKINL